MSRAKPKRARPAAELAIVYRPVAELIPNARNPRKHSAEQIAKIAASIREFGFNAPVLVDGAAGVIAGHGRLLAARQLGMERVPTIELGHLSEEQKRLYVLADNRLGELGEWDPALLTAELEELQALGLDTGLAGFDLAELEPAEISVERIETAPVEDRFWVSVRGPLKDQAQVLQKIKLLMKDYPMVEVELGTTQSI